MIEIIETPHALYIRGDSMWEKIKLSFKYRNVKKRWAVSAEQPKPRIWMVIPKEEFIP